MHRERKEGEGRETGREKFELIRIPPVEINSPVSAA